MAAGREIMRKCGSHRSKSMKELKKKKMYQVTSHLSEINSSVP